MESGQIFDSKLRLSVLIVNFILVVFGVLIFALAIWMRTEHDVRDWIVDLEINQYWNALYILMAAGLIVIIVSAAGIVGALAASKLLISVSIVLSSLSVVLLLGGSIIMLANCTRSTMDLESIRFNFDRIFNSDSYRSDELYVLLYYKCILFTLISIILELAGGILILVHGTHNSEINGQLGYSLNQIIIDSNYNPRANELLQMIQEKVGCCGSYNYQDYERANLPVPESCRDQVSGNVYRNGCVTKFSKFIEKRAGWIAGISFFVVALQILSLIALVSFLRREDYFYHQVPTKPIQYN